MQMLCFGGPCLLLALLLAAPATVTEPSVTQASEGPIKLKWAELIPTPAVPKKPKAFFAGRTTGEVDLAKIAPPGSGDGPPPPPRPEARWMSEKTARLSKPAPVVESLNGKRVEIGGYVVPLSFDSTTVKEFLLVPFVGACIHVPPPPANQIIYVRTEKGFDVSNTFEPVYVVGKLKTETSFTGLADTGYSLDAEKVTSRRE
ncbi:MAG: DUF3299 domain-containing protein [Dehalococcoidia bacterium]